MNSKISEDSNTLAVPLHSDVDGAIWTWAEKEIGSGFTVEDFDMSKVQVTQGSLYYEGSGDWFKSDHLMPEIFNNDDVLPMSCNYQENLQFPSHSTWKLTKILDSKILPPHDLILEFPCRVEGNVPISAKFNELNNNSSEKAVNIPRTYAICQPITIEPYTTVEGCVQLRTCTLENVSFKVELIYSGSMIVRGHKKRKAKNKVEVEADVSAALKNVSGFKCVDVLPGQPANMVYTMAGLCSGQVALSVKPHFTKLQTLV